MSKIKISIVTGNDGRNVKIADQGLTEVPAFVFKKYGVKVESLDFSKNRISRVNGLNWYTNLNTLILDDNTIDDFSDGCFKNLKSLKNLSIKNNKIKDIYKLLDELTGVKLRLFNSAGNPESPKQYTQFNVFTEEYQRFRFYVIFNNPSIEYIDDIEVHEGERKQAQSVGKFCRVKKIELPEAEQSEKNLDNELNSSIKSYFGYTKKEYLGLNSQGNRFIKDL